MCLLFHCHHGGEGGGLSLVSSPSPLNRNEACLGCLGRGRKIRALLILLSRLPKGGGALEGIMKSDEQE